MLQQDAVGGQLQGGVAALAAQGKGFDGEAVAVAAQAGVQDGVFQRSIGEAGRGQFAAHVPVLVVAAFGAQLQVVDGDARDLSVQFEFDGEGVGGEGSE